MAKDFTLRDYFREIRLFHSRLAVALVVTVVLLVAIALRLAYLQVVSHTRFATLADENRVNIISLPPTRGLIYDRKGVLMAQNLPAFSLEIVPEQAGDLTSILARLSTLIYLTEEDIARFHKLRRQAPAFEAIPLKPRLTEDEVARFSVNRHNFPGVDIAARLVRNYPLGHLGVHVLGYVGRVSEEELRVLDSTNYSGTSYVGKAGVEKSYEVALSGRVGVQGVEVNAMGRVLRVLREDLPTPGKNLILSIDAELQQIAEVALGTHRGALVAIEPATGDVLALVSTPTYDPNPFVLGIDTASYAALQHSPDQPLFNRALRGQYPPGSTLKPFVGLAGLEHDKVGADTTTFCPGWYSLRNSSHRYRDWKRGGHGFTDLQSAVAESCDVYFYDLSLALGIDLIEPFLGQFGFGQLTRIDVGGELPALLPSRDWKRRTYKQAWFPGETVIVGIGQGYMLSTPMQLASAVATLANGGVRMQPRTVKGLQDPDTLEVTPISPQALSTVQLKNPDHWNSIISAMTEVVHGRRGTAKAIGKDVSYTIAGKTGTAQVFSLKQDEKYDATKIDERLHDHAWFVAFAPVEKPRIAVAVLVENGGSGSGAAAPIARTVMDQYLVGSAVLPAVTVEGGE